MGRAADDAEMTSSGGHPVRRWGTTLIVRQVTPRTANSRQPRGHMSLSAPAVSATLKLQGWWKPKAANLLTIVYSVMLITRPPFLPTLRLIIASVVAILGIGAFGHVINDWCDIHGDVVAGKPNPLAGLRPWQRSTLGFGLLVIGLLPWLVLAFDAVSLALLFLEFVLLLAYAVPPLRLKQRGVWAVLADSAYAYVVPAVLAAHTFFLAGRRTDNRVLILSLLIWQAAVGIRHFLNHLALDRMNDISSGISTLATLKGNRYIHDLIRNILLPIELVGFLAYLLVMTEYMRWFLLIVVAIFSLTSSFHAVLTVGRSYPLFTYRFSHTHFDWLYQNVLPLLLLFYLLLVDWRFCALLLAHVLLFFMGVAGSGVRMLKWAVVLAGSPFRRGIDQSLGSAAGEVPASRAPISQARAVNGTRPVPRANIAIVNINKGKYTETFVQGLISRLHYNIYYLYGDELPRFDNDDRHFLSNWPSLKSLAQFLEAVLRLEKNQLLKRSIASYLQAKHIRLVLAEFGPVGIEMLPITRDLGIPLVVYFHGYDAFHNPTLQRCAPKYATLFREAVCVIGVSEVMLERLRQLGAPADKLVRRLGSFPLQRSQFASTAVSRRRTLCRNEEPASLAACVSQSLSGHPRGDAHHDWQRRGRRVVRSLSHSDQGARPRE